MTMTIEQAIKLIKFEIDRADRDSNMATDPDDLTYHNGEHDALEFILGAIESEN